MDGPRWCRDHATLDEVDREVMMHRAMTFLDELRELLRTVERSGAAPAIAESRVEMAGVQKHFLESLERAEHQIGTENDRHLSQLQRWIEDGRLKRFASIAERELRDGLCAGAKTDALEDHTLKAIEMLVGLPVKHSSNVRKREFARIVELATRDAEYELDARHLGRYAFENRFVRGVSARSEVSPIGRVLLDLPGADAVRWVLTVESKQSIGRDDMMRMHPDVLSETLQNPKQSFDPYALSEHGSNEDDLWPYDTEMFNRLCDLGVVERFRHDEGAWSYELQPAFRETLEDIVQRRRTPLSLLAESLLADERNTVSGHAAAVASVESSAALQARHARMVTHEIRNAIVPMRMALSTIFRTLQSGVPAEQWQTQRERVDGGIDRLFRFATELEQVARVGTSPPQLFDVIAAIHDAIKGLNGGLGLAVRFAPTEGLPRVVGHRPRFTLAIVNLLRNAAQNSGKTSTVVRVEVIASDERERLTVSVDDDGPGVPVEHREAIFQQGFALRFGGSGQGLALVREVVEIEMRGKARCEESDLGGARFTLAIPAVAKESS